MRVILKIYFKKINGIKVNKALLEKEPKLIDATKKTVTILCQQIKKYFEEHKIKTNINFKLIEDDTK